MAAVSSARSAAKKLFIPYPKLDKGEIWIGPAFVKGKPSHNVIVLPDEKRMPWGDYEAWAKKQGGRVITRAEQRLAIANAPQAFKPERYWSGEQDADDPHWAWSQWFYHGYQIYSPKDDELLVRAVRSDPI